MATPSYGLQRIITSVYPEQRQWLDAEAKRRRRPVAHIIREAIEEKMAREAARDERAGGE
jgi:predicted DNA-binding protein